MSWLWLWLSVALAGTEYAGVPVEGVEGFGRPLFQSTLTGWHTQVEDGIIRVYVAPSEEAAAAWIVKMRARLAKLNPQPFEAPAATVMDTEEETEDPLPPLRFEEAYGEPSGLLLFRDGNLGIVVHTKEDAMLWAQRTQAAAVIGPSPWPAGPTLSQDELGWWRLEAPGAVHIAYVGGERVPDAGLRFDVPPRAGIAWGPLGRATRIDFPPPSSAPLSDGAP
jgi:hypothetical protein